MSDTPPGWSMQMFGDPHASPVLLIHSIATSSRIWLPQVGAWSRHLLCLAVDLPGHGQTAEDTAITSIDDYADTLMAQIGYRSVSIVGLSLGGMIAQACALRYPERVGSVVIADSVSHTPPAAAEMWASRLNKASAEGMSSQSEDTLARWFTASFRAENPLTVAWIRSLIEDTRLGGYRSAVRAIQKLDYFDRLFQVRCPALIVTGSEDPVATPALATATASRIPGARVSILPGAAHLSNIEQPLRFTEAVGEFLYDIHVGNRA
jgi:3-oxoadipate enol-lactonase